MKRQSLVAPEDGDGGGKPVQRVGVGVDMLLQLCFCVCQVRDIDSHAGDVSVGQGGVD